MVFSSPGLSHLATEIFLRVDVVTFSKLEEVCKSWRDHIINHDLWKRKVTEEADPGSCSQEIIKEAIAKGLGKDEMEGVCRSLCNRHPWLG